MSSTTAATATPRSTPSAPCWLNGWGDPSEPRAPAEPSRLDQAFATLEAEAEDYAPGLADLPEWTQVEDAARDELPTAERGEDEDALVTTSVEGHVLTGDAAIIRPATSPPHPLPRPAKAKPKAHPPRRRTTQTRRGRVGAGRRAAGCADLPRRGAAGGMTRRLSKNSPPIPIRPDPPGTSRSRRIFSSRGICATRRIPRRRRRHRMRRLAIRRLSTPLRSPPQASMRRRRPPMTGAGPAVAWRDRSARTDAAR